MTLAMWSCMDDQCSIRNIYTDDVDSRHRADAQKQLCSGNPKGGICSTCKVSIYCLLALYRRTMVFMFTVNIVRKHTLISDT